MLTVSAGGGIGLPDVGNLFSASGTVSVMFNTTLTRQDLPDPGRFLPLLRPGDPRRSPSTRAAPGLDGQRNPSAPAGGEIYVKATIQAQLSIGGVLNLERLHRDHRSGRPAGAAYFRVDGAVGTTVAFIGTLTGAINLAVYVGAKTGVVGRIQLTRSGTRSRASSSTASSCSRSTRSASAADDPDLRGQHQEVNGRTVFDGFARDAAGNLVVVSETLTSSAGFKLDDGRPAGRRRTRSTIAGNVCSASSWRARTRASS